MSPGPGTAPTWTQRLLWTGQELHPEMPLYNMVLAFEIRGPFSPQRFTSAFQSVVDRSDALRSTFQPAADGPVVYVREPYAVPIESVDLSETADPKGEADSWMKERAGRILDPAQLFDCAVLRLGPEYHVWYLNQHHLITDAWSTGLLFRYVSETYVSLSKEVPEALPALPPYQDFANFLDAFEGSRPHTSAVSHWRGVGAEPRSPLALYGLGSLNDSGHSTRTERSTLPLGPKRSQAIRELAGTKAARSLTDHASRFNVFAALVLAYAARVSGRQDVALGAPAHNRTTTAFKDTLGVFIEVFPLRVEIDLEDSFEGLLASVKREAMSFLRYAQPGTSDPGLNRAVNVVLNYINATFSDFAGLDTRSRWIHSGHGDAAHDLRVQVHDFDNADEFVVHFDLSVDRFDPAQRALAGRHFLAFVDSVLAAPNVPVGSLSLVDDDELRTLAQDFSGAKVLDQPEGPTVVEAFRARVAAHPDRTAVISGQTRWSYAELQQRAIGVGQALASIGVRGKCVALSLPRSADAIAAVLGILEAGATYVPIDVREPTDRILHILETSQAAAAVTGGTSLPGDVPTVTADQIASTPDVERWLANHPPPADTELAYVLFTSGSTGRPKGVMVQHRSLAHYVRWSAETYIEGDASSFAFFTPLTFDLTVTSMFAPLLSGGTLVVYPDAGEAVDTAVLDVFAEDAVDVVKLTPSHLALVAGQSQPLQRISTLIVGGEELRTDVAKSAQALLPENGRVINEYGPTEATVACTYHQFHPDHDHGTSVPIGRPIPGARIFVVDDRQETVATGVAGEIVIGGIGVTLGYLEDPDLTRDRFITDPLDSGARAYRSGDLGRWRPDGTLECLGRTDRQVKIHGVRIEPAEIESVLDEHPGVAQSVVLAGGGLRGAAPQTQAATNGLAQVRECRRCGIPSDHPEVTVGDGGLCSLCVAFDGYRHRAAEYFSTMDQLRDELHARAKNKSGEFDCVMLLSGGKDSSYALYRLVELGLSVFAVTLDNGYISDGAKANVRRVTEDVGVPHVFLTSPNMNAIFAESLDRFSNVCQGCFKAMYTLAFDFALERGIPTIVTGLSRGQFFETRLTEELFRGAPPTKDSLELVVLNARKAYHRMDDGVNRLLDTQAFQSDDTFERVAVVDFYRYCDVELDEMLSFLDERAPWIRPDDTGRSTNCLINDVGIYVHKKERGFHNYALPYSWDVRMGHKERDAALEELDDDIDLDRVRKILDEIGYEPKPATTTTEERRLTAFVAGPAADGLELRGFLKTRLPSFMVPSRFVRVDEIPLTSRGKVDTAALERIAATASGRVEEGKPQAPPTTPNEIKLAGVWSNALGLSGVGIDTNFFDLGGDSITAIRIAASSADIGLAVTPNHMFRHQTIRELAGAISGNEAVDTSAGEDLPSKPELDTRTLDQVSALLKRADEREG